MTAVARARRMSFAALVLVAAISAAPAAPAASADAPHEWSVRMLDGRQASVDALWGDGLIVPSQTLDGGYIVTSEGASGPLDIRATAISDPSAFEDDLRLTFSSDAGLAPTTIPLRDLVREDAAVRVAEEVPAGASVRIDIGASLAAGSGNSTRRDSVSFAFRFTLSGDEIVVPPGDDGVQPGPGGELGATGFPIGAWIATAGGLLLLGWLLLDPLRSRRRDAPTA